MTIEQKIQQTKFTNPYQKLALNLIYTCRNLEFFLNHQFKKHDLTSQQYNILRILRGSNPTPLSIQQIRERMVDKMSDTSRIVDRLLLKKLVTKKICHADNRLVEVRITAKGLKLLQKLDNVDNSLAVYLNALTEREVNQLNKLLDKINSKS